MQSQSKDIRKCLFAIYVCKTDFVLDVNSQRQHSKGFTCIHSFMESQSKKSGNSCSQNWFYLKCWFTKTTLIGFALKGIHLQRFFNAKSEKGYHEIPFGNVDSVPLQSWFHLKCHFTQTPFIGFHLTTFFHVKSK